MKLTSVFRTNQFKRDAKALFKKHYDAAKLADAIEALMRQNVKSYAPAIAAMHCRETGKDTEKFTLKVTVY